MVAGEGLVGLPGGVSMHKDESARANVAPTNQSDSGWRVQLAWRLPNCQRNMSLIQMHLCPVTYRDAPAQTHTATPDST